MGYRAIGMSASERRRKPEREQPEGARTLAAGAQSKGAGGRRATNLSRHDHAGAWPQPSAPLMHSRSGVRPVSSADRVGEHTPDPA